MATVSKYGPAPAGSNRLRRCIGPWGAVWPQSSGLTITLAGQSMIRSDLRVTAPSAVPMIASLLKGDVIFTNFEAVVTEPGQPNDTTPQQRPGGGWLAPPGTLGSLQALGFQPSVSIQQPCVGSQGRGDSEHASGGERS